MSQCVRLATCTLALASFVTSVHAQTKADVYPSRPVRLIVNFAPGGGTDIMARSFAPKFTEARAMCFC